MITWLIIDKGNVTAIRINPSNILAQNRIQNPQYCAASSLANPSLTFWKYGDFAFRADVQIPIMEGRLLVDVPVTFVALDGWASEYFSKRLPGGHSLAPNGRAPLDGAGELKRFQCCFLDWTLALSIYPVVPAHRLQRNARERCGGINSPIVAPASSLYWIRTGSSRSRRSDSSPVAWRRDYES